MTQWRSLHCPIAGAQFIAGGTDLLTLMKAGLAAPTRLIDLKPVREMSGVTLRADGGLEIGALTTLAALEREALTFAATHPSYTMLAQAIRDAATPQLRAMATVGGNLLQQYRCWYYRDGLNCWLAGGDTCYARDGQNQYHAIFQSGLCVAAYPSDLAPALIALDARVTIPWMDGLRETPVEGIARRADGESSRLAYSRSGRDHHAHHHSSALTGSAWRVPEDDGPAGVVIRAGKRGGASDAGGGHGT